MGGASKWKRMNCLEKFPTTPPLFFGKSYCNFVSISCSKSPVQRSKICNKNFWIENDPWPPPFGLFRKFIYFGGATRPLYWKNNPLRQTTLLTWVDGWLNSRTSDNVRAWGTLGLIMILVTVPSWLWVNTHRLIHFSLLCLAGVLLLKIIIGQCLMII